MHEAVVETLVHRGVGGVFEIDAGRACVADGQGAGIDGVPLTGGEAVTSFYGIAPLAGTQDPELAAAFVMYVGGVEGQEVLGDAGFGPP